ncbi:MAG: hypothetical protein ACFFCS_17375 [Candidatus Hodarchaeota archaeon]
MVRFDLNKKLYLRTGWALTIGGFLFVLVPLILTVNNPTKQMLNITLWSSIIGGSFFIAGIVGLEVSSEIGNTLMFLIGIGLIVAAVLTGIYLYLVNFIPALVVLAILLLLIGIPSFLALIIRRWSEKRLVLYENEEITSGQVVKTLSFYFLMLIFTIGLAFICALIIYIFISESYL